MRSRRARGDRAVLSNAPDHAPHAEAVHAGAICARLVQAGKLDAGNAERALRLQREQPPAARERVGSLLVKLGFTSEKDVADSLASQLGVRLITQRSFPEEGLPEPGISQRFLECHRIVVLEESEHELLLVMAEPQDAYLKKSIELATGKRAVCCLGLPSEIEATIRSITDARSTHAGISQKDHDAHLDDVAHLKELAGEAPIIRLVNQVIRTAAERGASDIHIEPFENQLRIRYRVDGMLQEIEAPSVGPAAAIVSRVKIMANLDIAERRLSQDGRFKHRVHGQEFDLRVSTVPTMHGESVVLRLLQRDAVELDFVPLGFSPAQEREMKEILAMPHGIVLVTGPTGSGKSTTLYAALRHLNLPERMIITIEDPIEYNIRGINQMQVKPQIGLTFAKALRAIVRQDPDVIMVGEMRDRETAEIAVQSALTGHLVLSTLHTNDAPSSIMRLLDMGVQDFLLTSAINAIQAQRLVRTLCPACRRPYRPDAELVRRLDLHRLAGPELPPIFAAVGCEACNGTGYLGRTSILEILRMTESIRRLVLKHCDVGEIAAAARDQGMVPMRQDGLEKVLAGRTTIEEVLRVTPEQTT